MRIIIKLCSSGSHYLVSYIKQNYKLMNRNSQRKPVNTLKKNWFKSIRNTNWKWGIDFNVYFHVSTSIFFLNGIERQLTLSSLASRTSTSVSADSKEALKKWNTIQYFKCAKSIIKSCHKWKYISVCQFMSILRYLLVYRLGLKIKMLYQ